MEFARSLAAGLLLLPILVGSGCAGEAPPLAVDACDAYRAHAGVYAVCITRSATAEGDLARADERCELLPALESAACRTRWMSLNAANPAYTRSDLERFCLDSEACSLEISRERTTPGTGSREDRGGHPPGGVERAAPELPSDGAVEGPAG